MSSAPPTSSRWLSVGRLTAALLLLTLVAYAPLVANQFVKYDDSAYLVDNPYVNQGLTWQGWKFAWRLEQNETGNWHPVTWLSHMLDCQLFGLRPAWHHGVNLLLHLANVALLLRLLARLTESLWPSFFVAALFALHPLDVESVAWAAERKNVLSTTFWLLSTAAYVRYCDQNQWKWYAASLAWFLAGLLTKPMLVTLPCTLLLWDFWPLARSGWLGFSTGWSQVEDFFEQWWLLVAEKIPFFLLSAVFSALTLWSQSEARTDWAVLPLGARLGTMVVGYVTYLKRAIWPLDLAVFYPLDLAGPPWWQVTAALLVLLAISVAVSWPLRNRAYLLMGWCWYLGTLLPVSGILQAGRHATADRFTYVPLIGIYIMLAFGLWDLVERWEVRRWVCAAGLGVIVSSLAALTAWQVTTWRDQLTLFQHALDVGAESAEAHFNVAIEIQDQSRGLPERDAAIDRQVLSHLEQAVRLAPNEVLPRMYLAQILLKFGQVRASLAEFDLAVRIDPENVDSWFGRGMAHYAQDDFGQAIRDFQQVIKLDPKHPEAHYNLAKSLFRLGRIGEGLRHLKETMKHNPGDLLSRNDLAQIALQLRRPDEAVQVFREVVQLYPDMAEARFQLGLYLQLTQSPTAAVQEYRECLRLDAQHVAAANNLAWILATSPQDSLRSGAEAVQWAELACRLTDSKNPSYLDTLAAAQAEVGQFDQAVASAERSVALLIESGQVDQATKVQQRLNLYRQRQPLRDAPG